MKFDLPDLPYAHDALEPHISAQTMKLHHGKHHAGYVDKLNAALADLDLGDKTLEEVIQWASEQDDRRGVFNNAAQTWNHTFFWHSMAPNGGGKPEGALMQAIEKAFGDYKTFRTRFVEAGAGQFGSGWVWLVLDAGKLKIVATSNAETPVTTAATPLMTCDVWEHAYYLDHKNDRKSFLEAFIDSLVDWRFAAENLANQGEGSSVAGRNYQDAQKAFARSGKVDAAAEKARVAVAK